MPRITLSKVITDAIKATRAADAPSNVRGLFLLSRGPQVANLLAKAANKVDPATKEKVTVADLVTFLTKELGKMTTTPTNADVASVTLLAEAAVAFRDGKGYEQATANFLNFARTGQAQTATQETPAPVEAPKVEAPKAKSPLANLKK
jgi:hypothetical protein